MLVLEDGTGVDGANTIIDVAYADDFLAMFGDCWCGKLDEKERFIKLANYMALCLPLTGMTLTDGQQTIFPRKCAYDRCKDPCCDKAEIGTDEIPEKAKQAIALLAMGLMSGGIQPFTDPNRGIVSSFNIDGISVDFEDGKGIHMDDIEGGNCSSKNAAKCDPMPQIRALLACFMKPQSGVGKVRSANVVQRFSRPFC